MWIKVYIVERWHIYFESNVQLEKRIQEEIEQEVVPVSMKCIFNQKPPTKIETIIKVAAVSGEICIDIEQIEND